VNPVIVTALIAAIAALGGSLIGAFVQSRRLPSDIRLADAQAEKQQHEAASLVIANLSKEVERLKDKIEKLETKLAKVEVMAANANEFRRATIVLGEKLHGERIKVIRLVEIIGNILERVEDPVRVQEIKRQDVTRLVSGIVNGYPAEEANVR
jgi:hypothetical protein